MTGNAITSTYLTGWEYNRLLQKDPTTPRNSALPAEILWNGAAHLWLFEKVYCTKESLENEYAAHNILGWTSGGIFRELENRGIVEELDWQSLKGATKGELQTRHDEICSSYSELRIRELINERRDFELEALKLHFLEPIAVNKNCVIGIGPSSLTQREWREKDDLLLGRHWGFHADAHALITQLAKPLGSTTAPNGLVVCRRPGLGVAADELSAQKAVQTDFEAPMITALLAGDQEFAGPQGYLPYLETLATHRGAYRAVDEQLANDWKTNRDDLYRLRDIAQKHLWPHLHGDWLPALKEDPTAFAYQFATLLDQALTHRRFREIFNLRSDYGVVVASPTVGVLSNALASLAHLPQVAGGGIGVIAGAAAAVAAKRYDERQKATRGSAAKSLSLFYQKAVKATRSSVLYPP